MNEIRDIILALITGMIMGGAFTLMKLPIPSPQNIAGVVGIFGIFLGFVLVKMFIK
jgi:XapX domain-containing protein